MAVAQTFAHARRVTPSADLRIFRTVRTLRFVLQCRYGETIVSHITTARNSYFCIRRNASPRRLA